MAMEKTQTPPGVPVMTAVIEEKLPEFIRQICRQSPLQKKMIYGFLATQDARYWRRLMEFSDQILPFFESLGVTLDEAVAGYLKMCRDMLSEQIAFKKTGRYTASCAQEANARVYSSEKEMSSYMYGLALSQYLWPNHYGMFDFFVQKMEGLPRLGHYLEVGPGHGLFLHEAIRRHPAARFKAVDISPISIRISKALVARFHPQVDCDFINQDVCLLSEAEFDCIVMCELLEHLDDPLPILHKARSLLKPNGYLFVTTCANAPAIDHVYLYRDVEHIREHLNETGFVIRDELCLPVGNFPQDRWSSDKVEVNYAAWLQGAPK